jgi:NAD+ synthase
VNEQLRIIRALGVQAQFDAAIEARSRINFLKRYLVQSRMSTLVLGISGGVDSLAAALLAQRAVEDLRVTTRNAEFVAVRLPYGTQADEDDAESAIAVIKPDHVFRIDIQPASDAMLAGVEQSGLSFGTGAQRDFLLGNIKARQRMIAQYAIAGAMRGLVIGTDHAAEAVMGFFTKFGDGAADVLPLAGLNKRRVRAIASHLGAPDHLVFKVPTADLETLRPLRADEDVYGVTYDQIDDFLEGQSIDRSAHVRIVNAYRATAHKRALPVAAFE